MYFSIVIPVFNRPDEISELLQSLTATDYNKPYEIVIVEDGSSLPCAQVVDNFKSKLNISYFFKRNSGPGDSRNYGMSKARGDFFLIFDSDCIIPKNYLNEVESALDTEFTDCFGGPDEAMETFSSIQKAINFTMTSFLTTGGIRGSSEKIGKFQPRSFNMGISKRAFTATNGFGNIHPGEDPDLSIRLWKLGFQTRLFPKAFVFHKRRISWKKFYIQVSKFGKARPILNSWYPEYAKLTFFFPSLFLIAFCGAASLAYFGHFLMLGLFIFYFILLIIASAVKNKSLKVGALSGVAAIIQFYGYGIGFLISFIKIQMFKKRPENVFPELFFKNKS